VLKVTEQHNDGSTPELHRQGLNSTSFQKNEAMVHRAAVSYHFLYWNLPWPAEFPDFILLGYLKEKVF
jgi:hypothetical protein